MTVTWQIPYVEHGCTVQHEGRSFTAGGAVVTDDRIIAYPGKDGILQDWHGNAIGTWRVLSTWRTPRSFLSSTMSGIEARVNGVRYVGRGAGVGMIFRGRRSTRQQER
jgi:hypothetical protein